MKKTFLYAAVAALLCSCAAPSSTKIRTARTAEIEAEMANPVVTADLVVGENKVSATVNNGSGDLFLTQKQLEDNAIAEALETVKADVLVQPQFTYISKSGVVTSVSVTGYPGFYKNFRTVEVVAPAPEAPVPPCPQVIVYGAEINNAPAQAAPAASAPAPSTKRK